MEKYFENFYNADFCAILNSYEQDELAGLLRNLFRTVLLRRMGTH